VYNSGARPLTEPESRIAVELIKRLRPQVSIWFHQHLDLVDDSGGDRRIERRFAAAARLPLRQLPREPGSVTTWQNHRFPSATAFVVELPAGQPDPASVDRYAHAVVAIAGRDGTGQ
jgi:protein MpaA